MGLIERIGSDYAYLTGVLRVLSMIGKVAKNPGRTYPQVVRNLAATYGDRVALISDREQMTYRQYDARADQYARWAMAQGIEKGDVVALMMPNRPEYLAAWLGIARAGGVTALLNTNLSGPALAHCINIVRPRHVIVEASLVDSMGTAGPHLLAGPSYWCHGASAEGYQRLDTQIDSLPKTEIPESELPRLTIEDRCLFVYTSGTTGLPKAANINHYRVQGIMYAFNAAMRVKPDDRIYVCLPLYHTSGGVLGPGAALTAGASVVLRERFSSSLFWDDVVRRECTIFLYIGELCRYLLNSPTHPQETRHRIRLACGNGLRPDIWADFQRRFRIPKILEWYAATEGNCVFVNFDSKVGAVGRIPKWMEGRILTEIVRFDIDTEEPVRGPDGFCIKCAPGEIGEAISKIVNDPRRPSQRFEGYSDPVATHKKILADVFEKGDRWFRTGDLMKKDRLGYYYFIDRIGDTFRWKGENVATSEVSEALTVFPGIKEANVYGVRVPGAEGRVGMAALVVEDGLDLEGFGRHVMRLPAYARPVFLRIKREIETTSTFKQRKLDLVKESFDLSATHDPIYFLHPELQVYVPLEPAGFAAIAEGKVRL
ncbi:MAG TPA: long-chain-acyl-CoA synthetase [Propylenella sp.]